MVQHTLVDSIESVLRFEGRCSEKTWLVQILRRCIQKEQRRSLFTRAREAILGGVERGRDEDYGTKAEPRANWYENPEQLLLARERLEQIWRARRVLSDRQAEVWILRDVHQWTANEVSAALGLKPGNERVLLHRARQRLGTELQRYFGKAETIEPRKTHDLQRS